MVFMGAVLAFREQAAKALGAGGPQALLGDEAGDEAGGRDIEARIGGGRAGGGNLHGSKAAVFGCAREFR